MNFGQWSIFSVKTCTFITFRWLTVSIIERQWRKFIASKIWFLIITTDSPGLRINWKSSSFSKNSISGFLTSNRIITLIIPVNWDFENRLSVVSKKKSIDFVTGRWFRYERARVIKNNVVFIRWITDDWNFVDGYYHMEAFWIHVAMWRFALCMAILI